MGAMPSTSLGFTMAPVPPSHLIQHQMISSLPPTHICPLLTLIPLHHLAPGLLHSVASKWVSTLVLYIQSHRSQLLSIDTNQIIFLSALKSSSCFILGSSPAHHGPQGTWCGVSHPFPGSTHSAPEFSSLLRVLTLYFPLSGRS